MRESYFDSVYEAVPSTLKDAEVVMKGWICDDSRKDRVQRVCNFSRRWRHGGALECGGETESAVLPRVESRRPETREQRQLSAPR